MTRDDQLALGLAHHGAGRLDEAQAVYQSMLTLDAKDTDALNLLGVLAARRREFRTAVQLMAQAVALAPDEPIYRSNLGGALREAGRPRDALPHLERALQLRPGYRDALVHLGDTFTDLDLPLEALESYDKALAIAEDSIVLLQRNRLLLALGRGGEVLAPGEVSSQGPYAAGLHLRGQMEIGVWDDLVAQIEHIRDALGRGERVIMPGSLLAISDDPAEQLRCATLYSEDLFPQRATPQRPPRRPGPIRIGYLSSDFYQHPVGYMIEALIRNHDRQRFHVHGFTLTSRPQSDSAREMARAFGKMIALNALDDEAAAEAIESFDIDVLVDLNGHTRGGRPGILARRPARAQVNFLGYAGTAGSKAIDYIIGDERLIPPGDDVHYCEKVIRLPDSFFPAADHGEPSGARSWSRAEAGLPETGAVLCGFAAHYKLNPSVLAVWLNILKHSPGAVLWLSDMGEPMRLRLQAHAAEQGVDPDRLIFAERLESRPDHIWRLALADILLDTWPYGAHSTANEALWVGLPLLTFPGRSFASRVGVSLMHSAGVGDLVCPDVDAYQARAIELAGDPSALAALRKRFSRIRQDSPLFDLPRYTRNLEAAFEEIHRRSEAGLPPSSFDVGQG